MAYNREWDQGKDVWDDSYAPRQYPDGKRRKFNNGTHDGSHAYDDGDYRHTYARHNEWTQDSTQDDRSRGGAGGFPKKRLAPSEPSPHVIFLGLDPDFTEADLQAYLVSHGCSVETVTIIRERSSGTSKGFGFAQFTSIEHARAFVDPFFPFIQMPPPASHGASATAAFYKALETGGPHNGRRVKIDYSQSATPHDKGRMNRGNANDGTRDIGNTQSSVLLFRGLDPLSGPQAIYQAMLSSSGVGKEGAKGMRRIILIKDKVTMASFGFAFVEFVDVQSASNVLAATMSAQLHPAGFRISDRPVAASFAHPYSFQPVTDFLSRDEACLASTTSLGGAEGSWVRYWDETSTAAVLEFKVEDPVHESSHSKEKKEKKKNKETQAKSSVAAPSTLPITDKPLTLSFSKGLAKPITVSATKQTPVGFSLDDSQGADDVEEEHMTEPSKPIAVKKVAPLVTSKKIVNNINKWNQIQEELAHAPESSSATNAPQVNVVATPAPTVANVAAPSNNASPPRSASPEGEFEFSDVNTLTCLLCARQFKSLDQLKRHNKESDLHKVNYKDANLRNIARQKVAARKAGTTSGSEQPKYRDRASERRTLFNQPDVPMLEKEISHTSKKRQLEVPVEHPTPPVAPPNLGQDDANVGNKLLKMMGWREGTGLGSEGEGRVNPIETAVYTPGVGLGASKGKELGKYTEGFTSYVHVALDSARERYGS
ncbi:hypothetical protein CPC08DRAFT_742238 [Agrocybe pediades]|nr:hypothetical protein CPC08DRAFT_742238 [Agrocybe pediades]